LPSLPADDDLVPAAQRRDDQADRQKSGGRTLLPVEPAAVATMALGEFLAVVSALPDAAAALEAAVERAGRALGADIAAVVCDGRARTCVGASGDRIPHEQLAAVAARRSDVVTLEGLGDAVAIAVPLRGAVEGHLVAARVDAPFGPEEIDLAGAMARVMELTFELLHTVDTERRLRAHSDRQANENAALLASLRDRQRLLEEMSLIQRMISRREPLIDILDAIVRGAQELLGDEIVVLRQREGIGPAAPRVVAFAGGNQRMAEWLARVPMPDQLSPGQPILPDKLVHRYEFEPESGGRGDARLRCAIATPVHENGTVIGSLVSASFSPQRRYGESERNILLSFAEHVSLAITDANTLEAMYRAFHDSLTGLASRALFLDRLQHGLAQAARSKTDLTLLFIDLDRFKMVNDTLGHGAGDILLVEVAERLRGCLRVSDTAARFGGDEFVVLLHGTNAVDAEVVADRIIEAVRKPFTVNGMEVFVDASIGIAASASGSVGADDLLRDADVAMYRAKRNGRGRFATYEPEMHAVLLERLQLEAELRNAVERGEMVVHYQPIVSLAGGHVRGIEALLRWNHPRHGLMPAEDFVGVAEECGAILQIGSFALHEACRQAARWQAGRADDDLLSVTVNISALQLEQPELREEVIDALAESGLRPECLVIDITEALILRDEPWVVARLDELKELGLRLAIDDFGAGYSSLAALRQLPVDIVKIDRSFIEAIGTSSEAAPFARKIVELAHTLDLIVIAEGVQTAEQYDELRRARCELGQGFYFAEPSESPELPTARLALRGAGRVPTARRSVQLTG
jgi:diguanylate cyclase (GGDEF)-like protein